MKKQHKSETLQYFDILICDEETLNDKRYEKSLSQIMSGELNSASMGQIPVGSHCIFKCRLNVKDRWVFLQYAYKGNHLISLGETPHDYDMKYFDKNHLDAFRRENDSWLQEGIDRILIERQTGGNNCRVLDDRKTGDVLDSAQKVVGSLDSEAGIVCGPPGSGKTRTFLVEMQKKMSGKPNLYIAPTENLRDDAIREYMKLNGKPGVGHFVTYREFIQMLFDDLHPSGVEFIGPEHFAKWYAVKYRETGERLASVRKMSEQERYAEVTLAVMFAEKAGYQTLGEKESAVSTCNFDGKKDYAARDFLHSVARAYQKEFGILPKEATGNEKRSKPQKKLLINADFFSLKDCARRSVYLKRYGMMIFDESQRMRILPLLNMTFVGMKVRYIIDTNQLALINPYIYQTLLRVFGPEKVQELSPCYRCHPVMMPPMNAVLNLIHLSCGLSNKGGYPRIMPPETRENDREAQFLWMDGKEERPAIASAHDSAIIIFHEKDRQRARQAWPGRVIYHVLDAGGLTFGDVLVFEPFSLLSPCLLQLNQLLEELKSASSTDWFTIRENPNRVKKGTEVDRQLEVVLKLILIALSRSTTRLFIYQSHEPRLEVLFEYFTKLGIITEYGQKPEKIPSKSESTREEWMEQAKKLRALSREEGIPSERVAAIREEVFVICIERVEMKSEAFDAFWNEGLVTENEPMLSKPVSRLTKACTQKTTSAGTINNKLPASLNKSQPVPPSKQALVMKGNSIFDESAKAEKERCEKWTPYINNIISLMVPGNETAIVQNMDNLFALNVLDYLMFEIPISNRKGLIAALWLDSDKCSIFHDYLAKYPGKMYLLEVGKLELLIKKNYQPLMKNEASLKLLGFLLSTFNKIKINLEDLIEPTDSYNQKREKIKKLMAELVNTEWGLRILIPICLYGKTSQINYSQFMHISSPHLKYNIEYRMTRDFLSRSPERNLDELHVPMENGWTLFQQCMQHPLGIRFLYTNSTPQDLKGMDINKLTAIFPSKQYSPLVALLNEEFGQKSLIDMYAENRGLKAEVMQYQSAMGVVNMDSQCRFLFFDMLTDSAVSIEYRHSLLIGNQNLKSLLDRGFRTMLEFFLKDTAGINLMFELINNHPEIVRFESIHNIFYIICPNYIESNIERKKIIHAISKNNKEAGYFYAQYAKSIGWKALHHELLQSSGLSDSECANYERRLSKSNQRMKFLTSLQLLNNDFSLKNLGEYFTGPGHRIHLFGGISDHNPFCFFGDILFDKNKCQVFYDYLTKNMSIFCKIKAEMLQLFIRNHNQFLMKTPYVQELFYLLMKNVKGICDIIRFNDFLTPEELEKKEANEVSFFKWMIGMGDKTVNLFRNNKAFTDQFISVPRNLSAELVDQTFMELPNPLLSSDSIYQTLLDFDNTVGWIPQIRKLYLNPDFVIKVKNLINNPDVFLMMNKLIKAIPEFTGMFTPEFIYCEEVFEQWMQNHNGLLFFYKLITHNMVLQNVDEKLLFTENPNLQYSLWCVLKGTLIGEEILKWIYKQNPELREKEVQYEDQKKKGIIFYSRLLLSSPDAVMTLFESNNYYVYCKGLKLFDYFISSTESMVLLSKILESAQDIHKLKVSHLIRASNPQSRLQHLVNSKEGIDILVIICRRSNTFWEALKSVIQKNTQLLSTITNLLDLEETLDTQPRIM